MANKEEKITIEVNKNNELIGLRSDIEFLSEQIESDQIDFHKIRLRERIHSFLRVKIFTENEAIALEGEMIEACQVANAKAARNKPQPE